MKARSTLKGPWKRKVVCVVRFIKPGPLSACIFIILCYNMGITLADLFIVEVKVTL